MADASTAQLTDFLLPDLGEEIEEADVLQVHVAVGDMVALEQAILEIETEKATLDLPSSVVGTITAIHVGVGDTIRTGDRVLTVSGGQPAAFSGKPPAPVESPTPAPLLDQLPAPAGPPVESCAERSADGCGRAADAATGRASAAARGRARPATRLRLSLGASVRSRDRRRDQLRGRQRPGRADL